MHGGTFFARQKGRDLPHGRQSQNSLLDYWRENLTNSKTVATLFHYTSHSWKKVQIGFSRFSTFFERPF